MILLRKAAGAYANMPPAFSIEWSEDQKYYHLICNTCGDRSGQYILYAKDALYIAAQFAGRHDRCQQDRLALAYEYVRASFGPDVDPLIEKSRELYPA
jgi:hypothetical protein